MVNIKTVGFILSQSFLSGLCCFLLVYFNGSLYVFKWKIQIVMVWLEPFQGVGGKWLYGRNIALCGIGYWTGWRNDNYCGGCSRERVLGQVYILFFGLQCGEMPIYCSHTIRLNLGIERTYKFPLAQISKLREFSKCQFQSVTF